MDDVERAVDDGVNTFKALTRDDRFVPGAGATEIELAKQISSFGEVRWLLLYSLKLTLKSCIYLAVLGPFFWNKGAECLLKDYCLFKKQRKK